MHEFINRYKHAYAGVITVPSGTYADGAAANTVTFNIKGLTTGAVVQLTANNAVAGDFDAEGLHATPTADTLTLTFDDITPASDAKFFVCIYEPN